MPLLCHLAEIITWAQWRAAHPIREWKNRHGQSCFLAKYGDDEFHVGSSAEAAQWQVDEGQRAYRAMFANVVWC